MNQPNPEELLARVEAVIAERYSDSLDDVARAVIARHAIQKGAFTISPIGTLVRVKGAGPLIALGIPDCTLPTKAEKRADDARLSAAIAEPVWDGHDDPRGALPAPRVQLGPDATIDERFEATFGKTIEEALEG